MAHAATPLGDLPAILELAPERDVHASDGWDTDPPEQLARHMARLARLSCFFSFFALDPETPTIPRTRRRETAAAAPSAARRFRASIADAPRFLTRVVCGSCLLAATRRASPAPPPGIEPGLLAVDENATVLTSILRKAGSRVTV